MVSGSLYLSNDPKFKPMLSSAWYNPERIFNQHPMATVDTILDAEDQTQMVEIARQNQAVCIGCLDNCIHTLSSPPEPWSEHILGYYTETLPMYVTSSVNNQ